MVEVFLVVLFVLVLVCEVDFFSVGINDLI